MPVSRNQPSPQRQSVLTFVSPNVQDLLFFETVDAQRVGKVPPPYGTAHPDTVNYPNHILAYVKQADPSGQLYFYYYVNSRSSQDEYNFEFSQASLGQTKFDTVTRTYVELRSEFTEDSTAHAAGADMPIAPTSANFEGKGYKLVSRDQKRIGEQELDGVFVVEQRTYYDFTPIKTISWDNLSQYNLKQTVTYHYRGENISELNSQTGFDGSGNAVPITIEALFGKTNARYWKAQTNDKPISPSANVRVASYREARQLSTDWFEVIKKETVAGNPQGTVVNGVGQIAVSSYNTAMNHTFPPVLSDIKVVAWEKHDGQLTTFVEYVMDPEAFRGSCNTKVDVTWSAGPHAGLNVQNFEPKSIQFGTPYVEINIPPCLMGGGVLKASSGTEDPVYKFTTYEIELPTTNPSSIPETHVARDTQEPARGGYMRTKWTVSKPSSGGMSQPEFGGYTLENNTGE